MGDGADLVNDDSPPDDGQKQDTVFKDDAQLKRFMEASDHPYECICKICQEWWGLVGPEHD